MKYVIGTLNRTSYVNLLKGKKFYGADNELHDVYVDDCLIHSYIIYDTDDNTWYTTAKPKPVGIPKIIDRNGRLHFVIMDKLLMGATLYNVRSEDGKYTGEVAVDKKAVEIPEEQLDRRVCKFVEMVIRVHARNWAEGNR